ncbi:hypothetical protein JAAARDRAFT_471835 [Jaapia argillacea MUCL 33604]|uniref:THH1/TOM1/TOM3 domain-containing protein n=1 Tax=Jaapia argillacea MUCL 33604 TaxID=933084 RepID=A0A067QJN0_9AGAM|nr:hypothetical protein JAAARDRAFT_471835 [Jaapia argillacea MUCL 33604]
MAEINYASLSGIHSVAAAVVFAVIYAPLILFYIHQSIKRPTYVFIVLSFFCTLRVTAFVMRAILAGSTSAGENLNLMIAEQIIYSTGFFGLLYSAYTLVLDRELIRSRPPPPGPLGLLSRLTRSRYLIRIALMAAVALGITGAINSSEAKTVSAAQNGLKLRQISIYIFLAVCVLLAGETLSLVVGELLDTRDVSSETIAMAPGQKPYPVQAPLSSGKHVLRTLLLIALLLLLREVFFAATTGSSSATTQAKANNEALFYPLSALPELLAVCLFAVRGLVPDRRQVKESQIERSGV